MSSIRWRKLHLEGCYVFSQGEAFLYILVFQILRLMSWLQSMSKPSTYFKLRLWKRPNEFCEPMLWELMRSISSRFPERIRIPSRCPRLQVWWVHPLSRCPNEAHLLYCGERFENRCVKATLKDCQVRGYQDTRSFSSEQLLESHPSYNV